MGGKQTKLKRRDREKERKIRESLAKLLSKEEKPPEEPSRKEEITEPEGSVRGLLDLFFSKAKVESRNVPLFISMVVQDYKGDQYGNQVEVFRSIMEEPREELIRLDLPSAYRSERINQDEMDLDDLLVADISSLRGKGRMEVISPELQRDLSYLNNEISSVFEEEDHFEYDLMKNKYLSAPKKDKSRIKPKRFKPTFHKKIESIPFSELKKKSVNKERFKSFFEDSTITNAKKVVKNVVIDIREIKQEQEEKVI